VGEHNFNYYYYYYYGSITTLQLITAVVWLGLSVNLACSNSLIRIHATWSVLHVDRVQQIAVCMKFTDGGDDGEREEKRSGKLPLRFGFPFVVSPTAPTLLLGRNEHLLREVT